MFPLRLFLTVHLNSYTPTHRRCKWFLPATSPASSSASLHHDQYQRAMGNENVERGNNRLPPSSSMSHRNEPSGSHDTMFDDSHPSSYLNAYNPAGPLFVHNTPFAHPYPSPSPSSSPFSGFPQYVLCRAPSTGINCMSIASMPNSSMKPSDGSDSLTSGGNQLPLCFSSAGNLATPTQNNMNSSKKMTQFGKEEAMRQNAHGSTHLLFHNTVIKNDIRVDNSRLEPCRPNYSETLDANFLSLGNGAKKPLCYPSHVPERDYADASSSFQGNGGVPARAQNGGNNPIHYLGQPMPSNAFRNSLPSNAFGYPFPTGQPISSQPSGQPPPPLSWHQSQHKMRTSSAHYPALLKPQTNQMLYLPGPPPQALPQTAPNGPIMAPWPPLSTHARSLPLAPLTQSAAGPPCPAPPTQTPLNSSSLPPQHDTAPPLPLPSVPSLTSIPNTSSLYHIKCQELGDETPEPVAEKCLICKRDISFKPDGHLYQPKAPPVVAVLPCGHVFHDHCLQLIIPTDQAKDPPCVPCALGNSF